MKKRTIFILCIANLIYVILGGVLFSFIESNKESPKRTLPEIVEGVLGNWTCISNSEMEILAREIITAYEAGSNIANLTRPKPNWGYSSAIFFAITAITTIGYGNVTPETAEGQVACSVYLLIGIPLMAALLTGIGTNVGDILKCHLNQTVWIKFHPAADFLVKMAVVHCGMLVFVVHIPAAVFSHVEGWTYGESVYFAIITLTTVGFGDYYIDDGCHENPKVLFKAFTAVWIVIGLAVVATVISETVAFFTVGNPLERQGTSSTSIKRQTANPPNSVDNS